MHAPPTESGARQRLARGLYSAALYALSPLIFRRIWREQVPTHPRRQRLGFGLGVLPPAPRIWLHCASVGEVRAAKALIEALLARYPRHSLLITTMTATGAGQVQALIDAQTETMRPRLAHRFLPLDFPGAARRFVARVKPAMALMFETELWPNLLHACARRGVPVAVVNGRLSERAFSRYRRIRPLMTAALANVDWLAAKSVADAHRFQALGAPRRVSVIGSLKFDVAVSDSRLEESKRSLLGKSDRPVWVAGSTRDGEEALILSAHRALRQRFPQALLILVPRHPQRFDEVGALCEREGWMTARRSENAAVADDVAVYLGDTLGELATLYAAGDVAFVGGSLVKLGGHNVLEPAALGRPVLCGPSLENFIDVAEPLLQAGALEQVETPAALASAVAALLNDPALANARGQAGVEVIRNHQGALSRTLKGLDALLSQDGEGPVS
ncbi:lipid IV(A) 3-deoxy-D-manno-octulosonic acid transferase [Halomonas sp. PAMB 3232]|uniref:lipid IV(A) 3-deoxy-D-manno-octulosonic acid transferase n=1 Tax=Halomonas sp. PAMB 3232 TaxID=3075221 RepID=UPI0028A1AFD8|nr:lipid IV(A) 3-deoxy-D-manno-octulosonic acid transferase [Halomonas sp. PAMB 3232]WNL38921.1 lipid IV(A) 3-deoxy-D-manno-octulosonic acid transferase [Halomonas sp. PAMB 3232]